MKFYSLSTIIALILILVTAGCTAQAPVKVTWYAESSSQEELSSFPAIFHVHLDAVNTGNVDGKDVQADVIVVYNGTTIATGTEYFGTVNVGTSMHKELNLTGYLPKGFDKTQNLFQYDKSKTRITVVNSS